MSPAATFPNFDNVKMVVSDLDGTLATGEDVLNVKISDRNIKVLQALENKGIPICMASGRPPRLMIPVVQQAGLKHPYIVGCNGGIVLDSQTKEVIRKYSIDIETVRELIKTLKDHFGPDDILIGGNSDIIFRCEEGYAQKRWEFVGKDYHRVDNIYELATEEHSIEKLLILHREWPGDELFYYLQKHVLTDPKWKTMIHYIFSNTFFVEVTAVGICKATALKDLVDTLNIKPSEVIAFGDMPNDVEMLEFAGVGVAMGNAHPSVKAVADYVTATCKEDGVAVVLEEFNKQLA